MFIEGRADAIKIRNLTNAGVFTAVAVFAVMLFYCCVVQPLKSSEFIYYSDRSGFHGS